MTTQQDPGVEPPVASAPRCKFCNNPFGGPGGEDVGSSG
jgi:hypothetical protein